jgi:hypothetical protein
MVGEATAQQELSKGPVFLHCFRIINVRKPLIQELSGDSPRLRGPNRCDTSSVIISNCCGTGRNRFSVLDQHIMKGCLVKLVIRHCTYQNAGSSFKNSKPTMSLSSVVSIRVTRHRANTFVRTFDIAIVCLGVANGTDNGTRPPMTLTFKVSVFSQNVSFSYHAYTNTGTCKMVRIARRRSGRGAGRQKECHHRETPKANRPYATPPPTIMIAAVRYRTRTPTAPRIIRTTGLGMPENLLRRTHSSLVVSEKRRGKEQSYLRKILT